jgi:hypothetical protein
MRSIGGEATTTRPWRGRRSTRSIGQDDDDAAAEETAAHAQPRAWDDDDE